MAPLYENATTLHPTPAYIFDYEALSLQNLHLDALSLQNLHLCHALILALIIYVYHYFRPSHSISEVPSYGSVILVDFREWEMARFIALDSMTRKAWIELPQSARRKRGSADSTLVIMPGDSERA